MTTTSVTTSTTSVFTETSGNELLVASGGNVTGAIIDNGGTLVVANGGVESSATISSGGAETVSSGGSATGDQIDGALTVSGAAANETVHSGGVLDLFNGAVNGTTVDSGGKLFISGGNTASNTVLSGGGSVELSTSGSTLAGTLTFAGGGNTLLLDKVVSSAGTSGVTIEGFSSTDEIVVSGATAVAVSTSGGETIATASAGKVVDTLAFSGSQFTSATLSWVTSGGAEVLEFTAPSSGATTSVTSSTGSGAFIETSGNTLLVLSGGAVSAATIDSGGFLTVSGGADALAVVSSGGTETVSAGSATGDQIFGLATVDSGASVTSETIGSGGSLSIASGAVDSGATILAGGVETVLGSATGDVIFGSLSTISGGAGALTNATVENGGVLDLLNGNSATGVTVLSGGLFLISGSNAPVTSTVLSGGGTLELDSPKANISGSLTFAGGGNTLDIAVVADATFGDLATISGFSSTDKINVTALGASATLSFATSGGNEDVMVSGGGGSETLVFSGTTTYTSSTLSVVSSGGSEYVEFSPVSSSSGGTITVSSGVTTSVSSATSASYLVDAGGVLDVVSGGVVPGLITTSGNVNVGAGGQVLDTSIVNAGIETVSSGGQASNTTVDTAVFGAGQFVYGSAASTTVDAGTMFVESGGVATGATIGSGDSANLAEQFVELGGTATNTTIVNGGYEGVFGAATSTTIGAGGQQEVFSGGTATSATVDGGEQLVDAGGTAIGTTLSGGTLDLASSNATISGSLTFAGGGNTLDLGLAASSGFGELATISGFSSTDAINVTALGSGATLSFATSGGNEEVTVSGASGSETLVFSGTTTYTSGTLSVVSSGGSEYIEYNPASSSSGGPITVSAGETISVSSATSASYIVEAGGSLNVVNGGSITGETVDSGGILTVSGGSETSATILAGGTEMVSAGSASDDLIFGAISTVSKGTGVFTGETIENGGTFLLQNGNSAASTTVLSGGLFLISGSNAPVTSTVLSGGGTLELDSPKANISGSLTFAGGGNTLDIAVVADATFGDLATISGFSSTDKINVTAFGGAPTLSFATGGGNEDVTVGGAGGSETIAFSGATTYTSATLGLVSSGGNEYIEYSTSGFTGITTSVTSATASGLYTETTGNTLLVLSGGGVTAATIESGGFLVVDGGADTGAIVSAGGTATISAGSASGDQIFGSAIIDGGTVANETVLSGGGLTINGASIVSNAVLSGGGLIDLASQTATLSGSLVFAGGGNRLEAGAIASNGAGDQAVISGFSTSDKIDVTGISAAGATLSFGANGSGGETVTVSGASGGESFNFSNASLYNSGTMSLISDGSGGADLILDTTPTVAFTSLGGETNQPANIVNGTVNTALDPEAIGSTITIDEGNKAVGTATVGSNGQWSADVTFTNDDGANVLTATDTDAAGEKGVTSQSLTYQVNTAAAAFTAGNLVISISGDGDGSGSYGDNQASPITLEQITTSGTYVSQLVLPQTTTVVNGVTENAISGEYGSSSEGTLELSADGHSLTIAGYGVNANTFNEGGAAVYGNAALAQSTSVQGGQFTAVSRVIADINADGSVDTSTALFNVFNTNNPRSVATVNGSSFYISGQGVKGDTTQGVFLATDGASSATSINDATDTRIAEIYDGQLYVSSDSTQGATNISDYGALPTSATTPVVLTGLSSSFTLNGSNGNTVNAADSVGTSVNLSPENFFFANADTLYVADGGDPKNGGLGDGGLQKWVFNGTQWSLEYTLSEGLNLIPNTDSASSGDTGLIGLTGQVEANGTVELYATTEPLNDLGATSVVAITDTLSSTTGAGEGFSTIFTAAPGENVRGIAFAPTPDAPTITGTVAGQTTSYEAAVKPFSGVTIADANSASNANVTETLTITVGGSGGVLTDGAGFSGLAATSTAGVYTLSGGAAAVTKELDALVFTPTAVWPKASGTATFTLSDVSSADAGTPTVDTTTTVIDNDPTGAISNTAAYIAANIDAINADANVTSITLTDSGIPDLTLTAAQAADDTTALSKITNENYEVTVNGVTTLFGGNGGTATSDEVAVSNQSVSLASNSRMDLTGSSDSVTVGANSIFGVVGSNNAIAATSGDTVWLNSGSGNTVTGGGFNVNAANGITATIGGNGTNGADDYVAGSDLTLTVQADSRADAAGTGNSVTAGVNSTIGVDGSNNTISAGSGDTVWLNSGNGNTVTGSGLNVNAANGITATIGGNGANGADDFVAGSDMTLTVQSASRVDVGGSSNSITAGGNSIVGVAGNNNTISAGSGDTVWLNSGASNVVTAGVNNLINDFASASQINVSGNVGNLFVENFGADTSGVIELLSGAGGYASASAAANALTTDGHGGSLLSLGTNGSIDFAGVAANSLSAANFKVA